MSTSEFSRRLVANKINKRLTEVGIQVKAEVCRTGVIAYTADAVELKQIQLAVAMKGGIINARLGYVHWTC
jgi:galactitol-specific phosphotransferase system IIB component